LVVEIRSSIKATLTEADSYSIGTREKTPLAKTVRTCRQLLKVEPGMWLFVTTVGVEPTNNAAERAIRPAVIWRRTSFGSQTEAGSNFVARMLTVVTTLKSQKRNVLEFMTQAVVAARGGTTAPSLLPSTNICSDEEDFLKAA
jgi:transposase